MRNDRLSHPQCFLAVASHFLENQWNDVIDGILIDLDSLNILQWAAIRENVKGALSHVTSLLLANYHQTSPYRYVVFNVSIFCYRWTGQTLNAQCPVLTFMQLLQCNHASRFTARQSFVQIHGIEYSATIAEVENSIRQLFLSRLLDMALLRRSFFN